MSTCEGKIKKLDVEKKVKDKQIRNNETNNLIDTIEATYVKVFFYHGYQLV